eukprot:gene10589-11737_t
MSNGLKGYNQLNLSVDIEAGAVETRVSQLIASNDVIVFSKTTCPFCTELKRTLVSYGVAFAVFEIDETEVGNEILSSLSQKSGITTVPNLFIKGESYGGCTDVKALEHSGKLFGILSPFIGKGLKVKTPELTKLGLLWYPETVNAHVTRLVALFTCIFSAICVILYYRNPTRWAVLGLAMDCLARYVYGVRVSILGMLATAYLAKIPPRYTAGPPKQFSALFASFFSIFAAGLWLGGRKNGGAVVLALLFFFTFLESFLDFDVGAYIFGAFLRWKVISPSIYRPYLNLVEDKKWTYNYLNEKREFAVAVNEHYLLPGQKDPTPVDLIRKDRLELEYKLQDESVLRHLRVEFFGLPLAIAALAYCFNLTDGHAKHGANFNAGWAYFTLAVLSVVIYGILFLIYFFKTLLYPKKVLKEWHHPVYGNYFNAITICIVLYGILLLPRDVSGGGVVIWIGAIGQMIVAVLKISDLVYNRVPDDYLNGSILLSPIGNFITALAFARYDYVGGPDRHGDLNYLFISRLWFASAALFGLVMFTITYKKTFADHHSDERYRHNTWLWLATSSTAGPAYLAVSNFDREVGLGVLFQSLWCISLFFFILNSYGWIRNFHSYSNDLSIWIVPFANATFAYSTIYYLIQVGDELFKTLSFLTVVFTCIFASVSGLYTLYWLFDHKLFVPRPKWGPGSFTKFTHDAFRFAVPKYVTIVNGLDHASPDAIERFVADFEKFIAAFDARNQHLEHLIFPAARRYFPQLNPSLDAELVQLTADLEKLKQFVKEFHSKNGNEKVLAGQEFVAYLKKSFAAWGNFALDHLRNEESTIAAVVRKYIPVEYQVELVKKAFDLTTGEEWRKVLPWVVFNLPNDEWKVKYVKSFIWADSKRAQEIGLILYANVDSVTWVLLAREVPEIIPRGLPGFNRIY